MVMDAGRIAEFDEPHLLLQRPDSIFRAIVEQTGPDTTALLKNMAFQAYSKKRRREKTPSPPAESTTTITAIDEPKNVRSDAYVGNGNVSSVSNGIIPVGSGIVKNGDVVPRRGSVTSQEIRVEFADASLSNEEQLAV